MSTDNVFAFLEATLLDLKIRDAADRDLKAVMAAYDLTTEEQANLKRRMVNKVPDVDLSGHTVMQHHYASTPIVSSQTLSTNAIEDRLKIVDQTFDVKPIVVITTTTTTITVPTPTPTPTPTITTITNQKSRSVVSNEPEKSEKAIYEAAQEVKNALPRDRMKKLMQLALQVEASAA